MHEYSLVQSLMSRIEAEARSHNAGAVHRIELSIGEQAGVELDLFKTAFETFRHGSICSDAQLEVTPVAATWECPLCGIELGRGDVLLCRDCGVPAQLVAGGDIVLERIEMEASPNV